MIWESGESSISTWSLSGGSSEGSTGGREGEGEETPLSTVFWDGLRTESIVSSISDTKKVPEQCFEKEEVSLGSSPRN